MMVRNLIIAGAAGAVAFLGYRFYRASATVENTFEQSGVRLREATFSDVFPTLSFDIPGIDHPYSEPVFTPGYNDFFPQTITEPELHPESISFQPEASFFDFDFFTTPEVDTVTDKATLDELFIFWGEFYSLDPLLLKAIAMVESGLNPNAVNPDGSTGLMQVYCDAEGPDSPCRNQLNVRGWDEATPNRLLDPDFNVEIAAQILKWNLDTYGYPHGIAVYNSWSARNDSPSGPYRNQEYVDKVTSTFASLGGVSNEPDFT